MIPSRLPPAAHAMIAFGVFMGIVGLSNGPLAGSLAQTSPELHSIDIGVEHTGSATLRLDMTTLQGTGIAELTNESPEPIHISLPSTWLRREVRGTPIADVTADPPSFGYTRWLLPAGALVSFKMPSAPDLVIVHNPSGAPLKIRLARADLETQSVERDVVLVDEVPTALWEVR